MSTRTKADTEWSLASAALRDAYTDFTLGHEAASYSPATHSYYRFTTGVFLTWLEARGVTAPHEITPRHVREFLAGVAARGKSESTIYNHARAIRTLARFWYAEKYISAPLEFTTPKVSRKRPPVLTAAQVQNVLKACTNLRDRALVLFMVDSGLRREEVCRLNWGDLDFGNGLVRVRRGKGGKARSAVIGATVRRVLLGYRRTLPAADDDSPLFQARGRVRFSGPGLLRVFQRLSKRTGIRVTPHALRRSFATLSAIAGMPLPLLQSLMGHSSPDMTLAYVRLVDDDLLASHKAHSPIDNLVRRQ